jgi:hypothetical protein
MIAEYEAEDVRQRLRATRAELSALVGGQRTGSVLITRNEPGFPRSRLMRSLVNQRIAMPALLALGAVAIAVNPRAAWRLVQLAYGGTTSGRLLALVVGRKWQRLKLRGHVR